jgi:hypothetical protein
MGTTVAFAIPVTVAVAVALFPHARGPIIVGFVAVWLVTHWSLTFVSARRRRRKRG